MLLQICLVLCALLAWWKIGDSQKYAGYPPGPMRLPLLGNLLSVALQFTLCPPLAFQKLAAKYGDVMFLKMGMLETVVLSSYEAVTEVFQSDATDKAMIPIAKDRNMGGNYGLLLSSGNVWHTLRRFTIRTLRDFGFGKSASMDDAISEEYEKLKRHLKQLMNQGNGIVQIESMFNMPVLNVVWRLVTGKSYELDDAQMMKLINLSDEFVKRSHLIDISIAYPVLRNWFPGWSGKREQLQCVENLKTFFRELILEHKESEGHLNPECFIDVLLVKMEEEKDSGNDSCFTMNQLVYTVLDLFQASADTTSAVLEFSLLHMVRNTDIQSRVRDEINSVVPPGTAITMAFKSKLPYTFATLLETTRRSPVVSFPVPREPSKDIEIRGHKIKKGTPITMNFEAVQMQKSIWGDPEVFRPERFLTSDGTRINSKIADYLVTFSGGKRDCLGQSVAETTLLVYFANLIRHFEFKNVANQPLPSVEAKYSMGNRPHPFELSVVPIDEVKEDSI